MVTTEKITFRGKVTFNLVFVHRIDSHINPFLWLWLVKVSTNGAET